MKIKKTHYFTSKLYNFLYINTSILQSMILSQITYKRLPMVFGVLIVYKSLSNPYVCQYSRAWACWLTGRSAWPSGSTSLTTPGTSTINKSINQYLNLIYNALNFRSDDCFNNSSWQWPELWWTIQASATRPRAGPEWETMRNPKKNEQNKI